MKLRVKLFASLRETTGRGEIVLDLPAPATPEDVWRRLAADFPVLAAKRASLTAAVNRSYATFDSELRDGDEVVFVPPVSGG